MHVTHLKAAFLKATIVLVPSYTAAWLTDKMVFVVPTLAAAGFFASTIDLSVNATRRVDEDGSGQDDADPGDIDEVGQGAAHSSDFGAGHIQQEIEVDGQ